MPDKNNPIDTPFIPQSAQDQQNEVLEEVFFEKMLASTKQKHFDLKNYKPGEKSLVVPLAKIDSASVRPDDLELKAFQDAEQIIRDLGQGSIQQKPTLSSDSDITSVENSDSQSIPGKSVTDD